MYEAYKPHVLAVTATCGRHFCLERVVKCFVDQDYEGKHTLFIYNNSPVSQTLDLPKLPEHKTIILINRHLDSRTQEPYKTLGAIYNDIFKHIDIVRAIGAEVVCFMDDDDIFLPNHITEGVKGYKKATDQSKRAYKPAKSWYRHHQGTELVSNTLEPSMFVYAEHIRKYGFSDTTSDQHLQWVNPLVTDGDILVDPDGVPTLIYNWGDEFRTFKTSGDPNNPFNFNNYRAASQDHGDGLITPLEDVSVYYGESVTA